MPQSDLAESKKFISTHEYVSGSKREPCELTEDMCWHLVILPSTYPPMSERAS